MKLQRLLTYMFPFHYYGLWGLVCCWGEFCQFVLVDSIIWLPCLLDLFLLGPEETGWWVVDCIRLDQDMNQYLSPCEFGEWAIWIPWTVEISWLFFCGVMVTSVWGAPIYRGLKIPLRPTTLGRTPQDRRSARRKGLYPTTCNKHKRQSSMPTERFEPAIPASERPLGSAVFFLTSCRNISLSRMTLFNDII